MTCPPHFERYRVTVFRSLEFEEFEGKSTQYTEFNDPQNSRSVYCVDCPSN